MIKLLKTNPALAFIFVPLFTITVWTLAYFKSFEVVTTGAMPVYDLLITHITPDLKLFYCVLGCLLVMSQAFHFNYIINKHEVIYKNSWMPSLFYVLLMSIIPQFLVFNPLLIAMSTIIFILDKIFQIYKNPNALALDFDIGFLISLAALFFFPAILLYVLFAVGLIILKPFSWRDWVVSLMGLVLPFFFMFLYYFLTDQFQYLTSKFFTSNFRQQIDWWLLVPKGFGITIGYILFILMLALFQLAGNFSKNVIRTRNLQQVTLIFIIISGFMILLTRSVQLFRFEILCLPFSFLLSYYFLSAKKVWYAEVLFWLLIANIAYNFFLMKLVE